MTQIDTPVESSADATEGQRQGAAPAAPNADAEHSTRVKKVMADVLKPGFGNENKDAAFTRKIVQLTFQRELGNVDIADKSADSVYAEACKRIADNAEVEGQALKERYIASVTAVALGATRAVTLKGNVTAMEASKAYVNFKPSAKLNNQTFFNAL
jgi:hypothetical protein